MEFDPILEHQAGVLCEEGFMKERYDDKVNELIRTFTPKGISVVKNILEDDNYKKVFIQILHSEIKDFSKESQTGIINELKNMLK